jgi:hypothetical protein
MLLDVSRSRLLGWGGVFSDRELPILPDEMAVVAIRNTFEVVLMLWLGLPEVAGWSDFGQRLARP